MMMVMMMMVWARMRITKFENQFGNMLQLKSPEKAVCDLAAIQQHVDDDDGDDDDDDDYDGDYDGDHASDDYDDNDDGAAEYQNFNCDIVMIISTEGVQRSLMMVMTRMINMMIMTTTSTCMFALSALL